MYINLGARKFTPQEREAVSQALLRNRAVQLCPRCHNNEFALLDDIYDLPLSPTQQGGPPPLTSPSIPAAITLCRKCGFISLHALIVLGIGLQVGE